MKLDSIKQYNQNYSQKNNLKSNPNFTGWIDTTLRFLDTNQAWGANAVDLGSMVLPRTITDFGRGPEAGFETMRRESMGTINDSSVGGYGTLAGLALATGINGSYGLRGEKAPVKAHNVFSDSETLKMMGKIWLDKVHQGDKSLREFLKESWRNYEALSPNKNGEWVKLSEETIDKITELQEKAIKAGRKKFNGQDFADVKNSVISDLGVENNFRIVAKEGEKLHTSRYSVDSIIESAHKLGTLFSKENIAQEFKNAVKLEDVNFAKALKSMNLKRSLLGVLIGTIVGCSTQPVNMWLTKRKSGTEGFVGGGAKDNTAKFKMEKLAVAALFGAGVLASIGNPKNLIKNLQFKGFTPTINQLKFIYGATIMSRFLVARNENELKEASIKDILGFTNWLILGNFVQKFVVQSLDKSKTLIKKDTLKGNKIVNWIQNSIIKTRDEVLHETLGKDAFKDGKALKFSEMMKAISNNKEAKKKIRILTTAQIAGYVYSGLVLGIGIPKLNIYLTGKRMAKQKAAETEQMNILSDDKMLSPQNREFLGKNFTGNGIFAQMKTEN